jgi:hypothetical protein
MPSQQQKSAAAYVTINIKKTPLTAPYPRIRRPLHFFVGPQSKPLFEHYTQSNASFK